MITRNPRGLHGKRWAVLVVDRAFPSALVETIMGTWWTQRSADENARFLQRGGNYAYVRRSRAWTRSP